MFLNLKNNYYINNKSINVPHLKNYEKILYLPLIIIWFLIQLFCFSIIGGMISIVLSIILLIAQLFEEPEYRIWKECFIMLLLPLICTILWWYRYFKFGEYNILKGKNEW